MRPLADSSIAMSRRFPCLPFFRMTSKTTGFRGHWLGLHIFFFSSHYVLYVGVKQKSAILKVSIEVSLALKANRFINY